MNGAVESHRFLLLDSQSANQSVGTSRLLMKTCLSGRNVENTLETVSEAAQAWVTTPLGFIVPHSARIFSIFYFNCSLQKPHLISKILNAHQCYFKKSSVLFNSPAAVFIVSHRFNLQCLLNSTLAIFTSTEEFII